MNNKENINQELDNEQLLTVKQLSNIVGISTQAIYQRLDKDLAIYCQSVNGKRMLKKSVIKLLMPDIKKETVNNDHNELTISLQDTIKILALQVETMNNQLLVKDKQIEELNTHINSLMRLNENNQVLLLNQQQLLNSGQAEVDEGENNKEKPVPETEPAQPKTFFQRIFKRK